MRKFRIRNNYGIKDAIVLIADMPDAVFESMPLRKRIEKTITKIYDKEKCEYISKDKMRKRSGFDCGAVLILTEKTLKDFDDLEVLCE